MQLRPYQQRACRSVATLLESKRSVLLVAPTGSGKTVMGVALVGYYYRTGLRILWCAHRTELIAQALSALGVSRVPNNQIGAISPGYPREPEKPVQVASIQTLVTAGFAEFDLVILDEAHHYNADNWSAIVVQLPLAKRIGLTATPTRRDGRALGDNFEELVVAAQYSELIGLGHIVPCKVYQPERCLDANEAAKDPLLAYQSIAPGTRTFGFAGRIEQCQDLAERFTSAGFPSAVVDAKTTKSDRADRIRRFRSGELLVLWNVYALSEGVDVPEASTVIIARRMEHAQMYLQTCGRVLRPAPNKTEATIIDLSGASLLHGLPTEDREYSLTGEGIKRTSPIALRVCQRCGATSPAWTSKCPECGYVPPQVEVPQLKFYDMALRAVYSGASTPAGAKHNEYLRLRAEGRKRGWALWFIIREYKKLFGEEITIDDATAEETSAEYARLKSIADERGYKPGWISIRFQSVFGHRPVKGFDYAE